MGSRAKGHVGCGGAGLGGCQAVGPLSPLLVHGKFRGGHTCCASIRVATAMLALKLISLVQQVRDLRRRQGGRPQRHKPALSVAAAPAAAGAGWGHHGGCRATEEQAGAT